MLLLLIQSVVLEKRTSSVPSSYCFRTFHSVKVCFRKELPNSLAPPSALSNTPGSSASLRRLRRSPLNRVLTDIATAQAVDIVRHRLVCDAASGGERRKRGQFRRAATRTSRFLGRFGSRPEGRGRRLFRSQARFRCRRLRILRRLRSRRHNPLLFFHRALSSIRSARSLYRTVATLSS